MHKELTFIKVGDQSLNLSQIARIEWQKLDGELSGAIVYYANDKPTKVGREDAKALAAMLDPECLPEEAKAHTKGKADPKAETKEYATVPADHAAHEHAKKR